MTMDPNQTPAADEEVLPQDGAQADVEAISRQLVEAEAKLAEMRETMLRERADLDNQRKRLQRDLEQARKFANEKLLADLLSVIDNLERGLAAETTDAAALRGGVDLTLREMVRVVENNGLKAVGAPGEAFDPDRHQAMQMVPDSGQAANTIVAVFQKGYVLNERLLRPALVTVAAS